MADDSTAKSDASTLSFEDALAMLQSVVAELESGALTLDQTIEKFKYGSELAARCQRLIAEAALRITELAPSPTEDGDDRLDGDSPELTQARFS